MAIVIEEEKKNNHLLAILGWLVVAAIVVAAVYYIFFVEPPSALILPSAGLRSVSSVSGISVNPQSVLENSEFQSLQRYVPEPTSSGPVPVGRQNPFIAP